MASAWKIGKYKSFLNPAQIEFDKNKWSTTTCNIFIDVFCRTPTQNTALQHALQLSQLARFSTYKMKLQNKQYRCCDPFSHDQKNYRFIRIHVV